MSELNSALPVQEEYKSTDNYQQMADELTQETQEIQQAQEAQQAQQQETEQEQLQRDDPRNDGVGWNPGDVGAELSAAIGGGVQDAASSIATAPERAMDMFNGEMEEAGDDYKPEWDPFVDDDNPIVTKTWWGGLLRGFVQFGGLALGTVAIAKGGALAAGAVGLKGLAGALGWAGSGLNLGWKANLARGAVVGAAGDLVSKDSQGDNLMGQIVEHNPDFDNFLATKDTDHPSLKLFKNVVEGIGIGIVADGVFELAGYGLKHLTNRPDVEVKPGEAPPVPNQAKIDARNESTRTQEIERGKDQVARDEEYGAYKNGGDLPQGNATSNAPPAQVLKQANQIDTDWTAAKGATDSVVTAKSLQRMTDRADELGDKDLIKIGDELLADEDVLAKVKDAHERGIPLAEVFPESAARAKAMVEGRNTTDMTPEEFFKEFDANQNYFAESDVNTWTARNVVAADLINVSLFKEINAMALAAKEVGEVFDINDIDGPVAAIKERLVYSFVNIKRMKSMTSNEFRELQARDPNGAKRTMKETLLEHKKASQEAVDALFTFASKNNLTDKRLASLMDIFTSPNVHTLGDFHKYAMQALKGGKLKHGGPEKTGLIFKELGGVLVHSVLSGPKTIARALGGTGTMAFMRPLSMAVGAGMRGDIKTMRASLASSSAMFQSIPDSWRFFMSKVDGYWSGDIATHATRMSDYKKTDDLWEAVRASMETNPNATVGDQVAFTIANFSRQLNDNRWFTYSTKIMAAGDDGYNHIMLRAKIREKAVREAMDASGKLDKKTIADAEERFMRHFTDADGDINIDKIKGLDPELFASIKEITLTTDLQGFSKNLQKIMDANPWSKPFFLFARTGINGLAMTAKHTPGLAALDAKTRAIWNATPDNLDAVIKYGIETPTALKNEKALLLGRQAIGASVVFMAMQHFMAGNLRGNGPPDRQQRQAWIDAGWKPNTIKIGDVWVNYESMEPFNTILTGLADIGDNSLMMGEEWTKDQLQKYTTILMQTATSKSYIAGLASFVELFQGDPGKSAGRIIGGLANNTVPLSSLRNELGKLISPYTRELNGSIWEAIRNRNKSTEIFAGGATQPMPTKFDILTGKPINMHDFPTRMFNMFSPIQFNLDESPGRQMLFESRYDMRQSTTTINGVSLAESPRLRSEYQRLLGKQNLEVKLDALAKDPKMQASMEQMEADFEKGNRDFDPMKYVHNIRIKAMFDAAETKAWATLQHDAEVKSLVQKGRDRAAAQARNASTINNTQLYELIETPN